MGILRTIREFFFGPDPRPKLTPYQELVKEDMDTMDLIERLCYEDKISRHSVTRDNFHTDEGWQRFLNVYFEGYG